MSGAGHILYVHIAPTEAIWLLENLNGRELTRDLWLGHRIQILNCIKKIF